MADDAAPSTFLQPGSLAGRTALVTGGGTGLGLEVATRLGRLGANITCASRDVTHHTELIDGKHGEKIVWVVKRMEIDFRASARIDDILTVDTRTLDISGARIVMGQTISRGDALLVEARVEAAIIGETGRPRRFPKEWIPAFMPRG